MSLPWLAWSVLANCAFVGLEYVYRSKMFPDYLHSLPLMIPLMVAANYFLFNVYRTSPTFLSGWAVLSFGNVLCRFATNYFLGEPLHLQTIWGILVMLAGMVLIKLS
jgi:multidrug transporter EmrE-like cation transporter